MGNIIDSPSLASAGKQIISPSLCGGGLRGWVLSALRDTFPPLRASKASVAIHHAAIARKSVMIFVVIHAFICHCET